MTEAKTEFKLKNPPEDGISRVTFGPHSSQFLLVSSWDKKVSTMYNKRKVLNDKILLN